jgi:hypothetical protein
MHEMDGQLTFCKTRLTVANGVASAVVVANANFKGAWSLSNGQGFVITEEKRTTGACKRTTDLAGGYRLTACKVSGHKFVFTITFGPTYKSFNSGTFSKTTLKGSFHDTNGSTGTYTGTRP